MKIVLTALAVGLSMVTTVSAQKTAEINYEKEPPLKFQVAVNGKQYNVVEGKDLQLDATLSNPKLSIKVYDNRTLDNGQLVFDYPRNFTFEFEGDKNYKIWTLSGNSVTIMVFNFRAATSLDEYVNGLVNNFGEENCKVENTKRKLGEKTLQGKRINVSVATQKLSLDVLEFKPGTGFITIQDSKDDNGRASAESAQVYKLVDATIKYK